MERNEKGLWKKGKSGNPSGRPPVLLPEVQLEIDRNKSKLKSVLLEYLNKPSTEVDSACGDDSLPQVERIVARCLKATSEMGDVLRFRALLEIIFGKIPEDKKQNTLSPYEEKIINNYRMMVKEKGIVESPDDSEDNT